MKSLEQYISEKLVIKKNKTPDYKYFPKTKLELEGIIRKRIKEEGKKADLNDIDTSNITDMSKLFPGFSPDFNGDISEWDVSNVTNMRSMFYGCKDFKQDISDWDVSKVKDMRYMFDYCPIKEKYKPKFK